MLWKELLWSCSIVSRKCIEVLLLKIFSTFFHQSFQANLTEFFVIFPYLLMLQSLVNFAVICIKSLSTVSLVLSCQFRALADQFYRTPTHHKFVREQVINQVWFACYVYKICVFLEVAFKSCLYYYLATLWSWQFCLFLYVVVISSKLTQVFMRVMFQWLMMNTWRKWASMTAFWTYLMYQRFLQKLSFLYYFMWIK